MTGRMWFHPPVALALDPRGGVTTNITDVAKAAVVLLEHWPAAKGPKHLAAREACLAALAGTGSAEVARQALVEAGEEADLLRTALMPPKKLRPTTRWRRR